MANDQRMQRSDPYAVLGVRRGANEDEIRRRYLQLVRKHSPDRDPQRFAEIRAAYDKLRDPEQRLKAELFQHRTDETLQDILTEVQEQVRKSRIPTKTLLSLADLR